MGRGSSTNDEQGLGRYRKRWYGHPTLGAVAVEHAWDDEVFLRSIDGEPLRLSPAEFAELPEIPEPEAAEWVLLGDVDQEGLNMQSQYLSRYLTNEAIGNAPFLAEGLRVDLSGYRNGGNYHAIRIHRDDAAEFIRRVKAQRGVA